MFLLPTSHSNNYCLEGRLVGHTNAINCLAVSRNGYMLASGGSDRMRIWDLKRQAQLPIPPQTPAIQNPADLVTCTCWITCHEAMQETLCYGTGLSFIGIWQQQGEGLQDFDAKYQGGLEQGPLILIFSIKLATTIPHTINFNCAASRNILVFSMYDGEIHTLRGTDGAIITTNNAGPLIGHASVDAGQTLFLMDNVVNGFSLHCLDDAGIVQLVIAMGIIACVLGQYKTLSLASLGNVWQEYSKFGDQLQDLPDDVHLLLEKYIKDQRGGVLERLVDNGKHDKHIKSIILGHEKLHDDSKDMHAVILLGS
ncbi:uncharacterized protein BJ212DRAFT_1304479 [Suillus subaureus]|uniref:Uncharacterized protein n=1 Tax=Suillus subaureus TaxID=48587 RepID=A0A9P7DVL0_9AGAM|nr:uncharacterized protein BJ212DRAFT_1304479 [Suillus subaureus]KAG1803960.1 hypothetical protein BJ212DRAFT_1304479 [Suillus subaureus]